MATVSATIAHHYFRRGLCLSYGAFGLSDGIMGLWLARHVPGHLQRPVEFVRRNVALAEFGGAFGDLSTWIPLVLALSAKGVINFSTAVLFAGVYNLAVFFLFSVPIPVQPMHTIAGVAISDGLSAGEVAAAGVLVGAAVLLLSVTRTMEYINRFIPLALVRGIQLGVGLGLFRRAFTDGYIFATPWSAWDGPAAACIAAVLLLIATRNRSFPGALIVFCAAAALGVAVHPGVLSKLTIGPSPLQLITPTWAEWHRASVAAFLPQLPLTTLNSVVAVSQLARDLYPSTPEHPAPVTRTALSVGILNAAFCWLGAVPSCHGSGGLAAQHALGARSSVSMLFLGTIRVVFALLFGSSMLSLVAVFPSTVLGAMLCVAGVQLAACAFDMESEADVMVLLATAGGTIALGGTGPGFLVGCATAATLYAVHTITPQAADARVRPTTDSAAEEPQPRRIPFWVFFTTGSSMLEEKRVVRSARQGPESGLLAYSAVEAATDE